MNTKEQKKDSKELTLENFADKLSPTKFELNVVYNQSPSIIDRLIKYFKGIGMAIIGKVSESNTYDATIHCN